MTVLAVAVNPVPAAAADADARDPGAVIAAAIDGDTMQLADGRLLRLAAIMAPKGEEPLAAGTEVEVVRVEGLLLRVRRRGPA